MSDSDLLTRPSQRLRARREDVLELIRRLGAENPRVFGSVGRGTDTPSSDIDILVSVAPEHAWGFVSLSRELSELLGVRVDVVSDRGLTSKHAEIVREARPL